MAGITLTQAQSKLTLWMNADDAVTKGQSISVAGRSMTKADAGMIRENIEYWDKKVRQLSRGGKRVRLAVPNG